MRNTYFPMFGLFATISALFAQSPAPTGSVLVDAGYSRPTPPELAPGQVITLFFRGVKPLADGKLRSAQAEKTPLPETLAGLSVRIEQADPPTSVRAPILSVRQETECGATQSVTSTCLLTSVRVQIPFELSVVPASSDHNSAVPVARLILEEDGQLGNVSAVQPVAWNGHVVTSCDMAWDTNPASTCSRVAYHADGKPVDRNHPAKSGEIISIYAYGLGPTWISAETGKPSPEGAEVVMSGVRRVWASLRNEPVNASDSLPRFFDAAASDDAKTVIEWVGLTPGQIGLYQLNLAIPVDFKPLIPCGPEVHSNAAAWVTTSRGSEVVPFCMIP